MGLGVLGMGIIAGALLVGAFLLVGAVAYRLIGMYLLKEIDGLELAVFLAVLVGLMAGALAGGGPLAVAALVLLWVVGAAYPVINHLHWRYRMNAMLRDDIRAYEAALKRQPDVPFPHRRLGDIYFDRGDWDRAVEHYQAYLEIHEINAYCAQRLERSLLNKRRHDLGLRACPICGAENPGNAGRCEACGFYLRGARELWDVLTTPGMMRLWRWVIVAFLVPALVLGLTPNGPVWVSVLMLVLTVVATSMYIHARLSNRERSSEL